MTLHVNGLTACRSTIRACCIWAQDTLGVRKDMEEEVLMISMRGNGHVLDRQRCCAG